ncbi:hypothetical protein [Streptomyces sp. NPDC020141]|uniref:hypothetical protein n=1 Tax=Streptomyces sp. NPDC020141 TaxID=3365065 RepID=UPI003795FB34
MSTTTYWHWTIAFDEPSTGKRLAAQGECIGPADATSDSVLKNLAPNLNRQLAGQYGPGYRIENLAPSCRIEQK